MDGLPWWTFVFFLPVLALMALPVWAVVDGVVIPSTRWQAVGRRGFTSPIGPLYYLLRLRPRLRG